MPLRFRRTIKVAPGVKLNLSKSGVSTTVGTKNLKFNFGKRGVKRTVSIPGTGIQEVDYIDKKNKTESEKEKEKRADAREKRHERLQENDPAERARRSEAAIPNTGNAAAREAAAAGSTGLRNFFVLLAIVVFFFVGASVMGLIPPHFFSNSLHFVANMVRSSGH